VIGMSHSRVLNGTSPLPRIGHGIVRAFDWSITALIESARIFILAAPIVLSVAQMARADVFTTETIEYEESAALPSNPGIASFGPFTVVSANLVEMIGETDESTPGEFRKMIAAFPQIRQIRMIDCPGTENDEANFSLARMIRRAGISTYVPKGGSVRSGGVELFLAGVHRAAEPGAEFGVHSWLDADGREARDVPANDPAHREYVHYYEEVGFSPQVAREFYAFTNAVAFDQVHYLTGQEIAHFQLTN
jgi:hypothetical protein